MAFAHSDLATVHLLLVGQRDGLQQFKHWRGLRHQHIEGWRSPAGVSIAVLTWAMNSRIRASARGLPKYSCCKASENAPGKRSLPATRSECADSNIDRHLRAISSAAVFPREASNIWSTIRCDSMRCLPGRLINPPMVSADISASGDWVEKAFMPCLAGSVDADAHRADRQEKSAPTRDACKPVVQFVIISLRGAVARDAPFRSVSSRLARLFQGRRWPVRLRNIYATAHGSCIRLRAQENGTAGPTRAPIPCQMPHHDACVGAWPTDHG